MIFRISLSACLFSAGMVLGAAETSPVVKTQDIVYSSVVAGKDRKPLEQKLTLSRPAADKPLPCFVYIHGGGWHGGHRHQTQFKNELLAAGWAYASIDYRLNAKCTFPLSEQLDDCRAAVRFLQTHADKYGVDPQRICVAGGSAGGHLASLLAVMEGVGGGIVACVDSYGPTDLRAFGEAEFAAERAKPGMNPRVRAVCEALGTTDIDGILAKLDALSPLAKLAKMPPGTKLPRFLILHAKGDPVVPVRQSETFAAALEKSGADVTLKVYDGNKHAVPSAAARDVLAFLSLLPVYPDSVRP